MSTILISSIPEATELNSGDWLVKDTGTATNKISATNACATATKPGLVSTSAQTIAGEKTFTSPIKLTDGTKTVTLAVNNEMITLTPATNVSISSQVGGVVRNGNVVCGYVRFTTSAEIAIYGYLFTGLPPFAAGQVIPLCALNNTQTTYNLYADASNAGLRATAALPAGTYNVSFTYIAQ